MFKFIKENFVNSPSADLTPEVMDMLMAVMLVRHNLVANNLQLYDIFQ